MAAAGLTHRDHAQRRRSALPRAWLRVYLALWATTLAAAGVSTLALGGSARALLHLALAGRRAPAPSLVHGIALLAHNLPIAAWPLLLGRMRARARPATRALADAMIVLCALANALPVGIALGGYGSALLAYLPHLPLEWAALALGYASWLAEREDPLGRGERSALLALIGCLLGAAAALETLAIPHR